MKKELLKCIQSFEYFCENYVKILHYYGDADCNVTALKEVIPFKLYDFQKRYIKFIEENKFVIGTKFRQGGFSKLNIAYMLWVFLFKLDKKILMLHRTDREACWSSWVFKNVYQRLPEWMHCEFGKNNDHTKENKETGTIIKFMTPQYCCGTAIDYLVIDEAAFIKDMEKHWKAMYPTIANGRCIVMSTPNGQKGWFYEAYKYKELQKEINGFKTFKCNYKEYPEYATEAWESDMKVKLGEKGWKQEVLQEFLPI